MAVWQYCRRGDDSPLRCAGLRCDKPLVIEDPSLEPSFDQSVQGRGCLQLTQEGGLVDAVATLGDISVQGVLGLLLNRDEDRTDGIVDRASGAESVAVGLKLGLPLRLQGVFDQGLPCPIMKRGNRERAVFVCSRFGIPTRLAGLPIGSLPRFSARACRWGGVSDLIPSIPAVCLPWLSWVTRRTARNLAARDFKRSFCNLWTLRTSPACEALKIRRWSLNTAISSLRQGR